MVFIETINNATRVFWDQLKSLFYKRRIKKQRGKVTKATQLISDRVTIRRL